MFDVVPNDKSETSQWVADRVGATDFGACVSFGIYQEGKLVAGVVYSEYREVDIMLSAASEVRGAFTKKNMKFIYGYPFEQLGVRRVSAFTEIDNTTARNHLERMGFKKEGRLRQMCKSGKDGIFYGMLRSECRYLGEENG
jgi:RimJ/RimL family protein N-acetyltransferase